MNEGRADARIRRGQKEGQMHIAPRGIIIIWKLMLYVLLLALPMAAQAAPPWPGILDPSRAIDWSEAGIPGGIQNRTTVCASLNASTYGNGSSDATSAIQAALNSCPAGQVVLLSAGKFRINTSL